MMGSMITAEAYEPPPPNEWVRPMARAVLATLIGIGVAGWVFGPGPWPLKAAMCVVTAVLEGWGFNAAVQWSRALSRQGVTGPLVYWSATVVGCAGWTIFSIYHALGLISGDMGPAAAPAYVAFTALAVALPFHEWAIDRNEAAPKKPSSVANQGEAPAPSIEPRASGHASRTIARALSGQRPRNAAKRRGEGVTARASDRRPPLSEQEIRDALVALSQQGKKATVRSVAAICDNAPTSRVERSPGYYLLKQAA